jgi:hypothetical protein
MPDRPSQPALRRSTSLAPKANVLALQGGNLTQERRVSFRKLFPRRLGFEASPDPPQRKMRGLPDVGPPRPVFQAPRRPASVGWCLPPALAGGLEATTTPLVLPAKGRRAVDSHEERTITRGLEKLLADVETDLPRAVADWFLFREVVVL